MPSFAAAAHADGAIERAAPATSSVSPTVALAGVSALLLAAPFEGIEPLLILPGQSLSSAEVVLLAAGLGWLTAVARSCQRPAWRTRMTAPWLALVAVMTLSALVAPDHRSNALDMAGRFGLALGVYLLTLNAVTSVSRLRTLFIVSTAAGLLVAALVILESLGIAGVTSQLEAFRGRPAVVGTQLRAAGPFQYTTIASMFLEILFALGLAWIPLADDARRPWLIVVALVVLAVFAEAIVLTFTRAGLITMIASLLLVGAHRWWRRGIDRAVQGLAALGAVIATLLAGSHSLESLQLRMTTEGMDAWFRASIDAPDHLQLETGTTVAVPVVVENIGRSTWDPTAPNPFRFAYHWLLADDDVVVNWEGERTPFPAPVGPGERVTLHARVRAPSQPGEYRILWDVEHEKRLWFSTEPDAPLAIGRATVTGPAAGPVEGRVMPLPLSAVRPGRLALWGAAGQMLLERPLLGIGPDNFRLTYGPYLNRPRFDTRLHTNSMYVEVLVGGGIVAGLVFLWLLLRLGGLVRTSLGKTGPVEPFAAASAAAVAAVAIHGLVDAFWSFTATYVLIAITFALATRVATSLDTDAHRV